MFPIEFSEQFSSEAVALCGALVDVNSCSILLLHIYIFEFPSGFLWCITEVYVCVCVYIMDLNCALRRIFLIWITQTSQPSVRFVLWFLLFSATNLLTQRPIQNTFSHFIHLPGQNRAFSYKQCLSNISPTHQKHTTSSLEPKSERFANSSPAQR